MSPRGGVSKRPFALPAKPCRLSERPARRMCTKRGWWFRNIETHQITFKRMTRFQERFFELLADIDVLQRLKQRIAEAFEASQHGTCEPADWRNVIFNEKPQI